MEAGKGELILSIKYYSFETPIGEMTIFFSEKGIVYLNVKGQDDVNMLKRKYGQVEKVDMKDKEYHKEIIEYLEGNRREFTLPLDLIGTDFQRKVWKGLLDIPYGEIRTYKDIAETIGNPKAYRAVGNALNKNPVLIVVPCHRVIGSNGQLVGFGGGLELKRWLLDLERGYKKI